MRPPCLSPVLASVGLALASCGGDAADAPAGPIATLHISERGFSPAELVVHPGQLIAYVNDDVYEHAPVSLPHDTHADCPTLNAQMIEPGDVVHVVAPDEAKDCGIHDHLEESFTARIRVRP